MPLSKDDEPRVAILVPPTSDHEVGNGDDTDHDEVVAHPSRIIRLASMAQAMLAQIEELDLDEAARHRFATVFNRTIEVMGDLLSDDLKEELEQLDLHVPEDASTPELRIAQAQLVGWLEGLFHGIRTAVIAHNLATQEELARAFQEGIEAERNKAERRSAGQYL
ncbi:MAG: proteasome activator [Nitriliruptorales bacterium]|nr:proteasome activator [Nitriliruptorales bacterium]